MERNDYTTRNLDGVERVVSIHIITMVIHPDLYRNFQGSKAKILAFGSNHFNNNNNKPDIHDHIHKMMPGREIPDS